MHKRPWRRHRPLFAAPLPREAAKPKVKWRILPILWLALKRTCMVLGAVVLFSAVIGVLTTLTVVSPAAPSLPDEMVLYIDFDEGFREVPREVSFTEPFVLGEPTMREFIAALDRAGDDPRVKGILARMSGSGFALSHIQEVRAALKRFQENGKFAYIYSPSFAASGLGGYYLASGFDELWMQPMGAVSVAGINAEMPFFRAALDKIGVQPQFFQRKEYKTVYESLTNTEISPENKEMLERLLGDISEEITNDIAADRGLNPSYLKLLIDKGLFTAGEAFKNGLITEASYADILVENIKEDVTGDREADDDLFVGVGGYIADMARGGTPGVKSLAGSSSKIALIYTVGTILSSGMNAASPAMMGGSVAAADEIVPAIMDATDDEDIQAIVLRIDSPGGSPTASESILRAIKRAQEKGTPVIVSMGPTAASGGYWVATHADMIFAMPTTLTGSIGVAGGKFALESMWEKLGVNWDAVRWGKNAGLWSPNAAFSPAEQERIEAMLDQIYRGFVWRVADGRRMKLPEVNKIARGQVWSGKKAVEIGLVDEIGGLDSTLDFTAALLGFEDRHDLNIVVLPRPKTPFEQFIALLSGQASVYQTMKWQQALFGWLQPVLSYMNVFENTDFAMTYDPLTIR